MEQIKPILLVFLSDPVLIAIIVATGGIISLLIKLLFEMWSLKKHVNSRMSEMLELTKGKYAAEAKLEEKAEVKAEAKAEQEKSKQ